MVRVYEVEHDLEFVRLLNRDLEVGLRVESNQEEGQREDVGEQNRVGGEEGKIGVQPVLAEEPVLRRVQVLGFGNN